MNLSCFFTICMFHPHLNFGSFCLVCSAILVSSKAWQKQRWPSLAVSNEGLHAMEATFVALGEVSSSRRAWSRQSIQIDSWRVDFLFIFSIISRQWFILRISISTYSVVIIYNIYKASTYIIQKLYSCTHSNASKSCPIEATPALAPLSKAVGSNLPVMEWSSCIKQLPLPLR